MVTDRYQHIRHVETITELVDTSPDYTIVAIDNLPGALPLETATLPRNALLLFGRRAPGSPTRRGPLRPSSTRSPSSARPDPSTPASRPASPCTPGSASTQVERIHTT